MIDNYERLVGRLMDLETKFYELQDKYQNLIDSYEKLKETHDADKQFFNYRSMLIRYINHVGEEEGTSFLGSSLNNSKFFTIAEKEELRVLDEETQKHYGKQSSI